MTNLRSMGASMGAKQAGPTAGHIEEVARLLNAVVTVSTSSIPVLLLGPKGSGLDLLARCIHCSSPREIKPLVIFRCGTSGSPRMETQFLGSPQNRRRCAEKGQAHGRLHEANGGTLFIDQVQNAPMQIQTEILRVITEGAYVDTEGITHPVDVRFVVSAWYDLTERAAQGRFRADLFERISRVALQLRKGSSDKTFILQAVELLRRNGSAKLPGDPLPLSDDNGRHEEIATLQAVLNESNNGPDQMLSHQDLLFATLRECGKRNSRAAAEQSVQAATAAVRRCLEMHEMFDGRLFDSVLSQLQRTLIERALVKCNGVVPTAAAMLGISVTKLRTKAEEFGVQCMSGANCHGVTDGCDT